MSAKELNIGDYVRTKNGEITKITKISIDEYLNEIRTEDEVYTEYWHMKSNCLHIGTDWKSSPKIINLIQAGDYVNGHLVICKMYENEKNIPTIAKCIGDCYFKEEDIKSIVTKEQFESMEYKIGE